jgi:hypothetical protein
MRPEAAAAMPVRVRPSTDAEAGSVRHIERVTSIQTASYVGFNVAIALLMVVAGAQKKKLRWKEGHRCRSCGAVGSHRCPRRLVP